jgi:molecular chaperone GrpE
VEEAAIPATRPHLDAPLPTGTAGLDREPYVKSPEAQEAVAVATLKSLLEEVEPEPVVRDELREELEEWRDRALRQQADMENYRKRQQRIAQEQIGHERSRLLNAFLGIVDDLERALAAPDGDGLRHGEGLRRGVELTHRTAMQLLQKEGAVAISAEHQPFDPNWHEAVATIPRNGGEVAPGTVVQVIESGYRIDDRLLRPAKVVVAA